jgi:hypothetical protein
MSGFLEYQYNSRIRSFMSRFLVLLVFVFVAGCSGSGGSAPTPNGTTTTTTTTTTPPAATCVAAHEPLVDASGSHAIAWTKTYCGPSDQWEGVYLDSSSTDDSGQVLGTTRDLNRGRVTWDFTGLDYTDLLWPTDDMMFMVLKRIQSNGFSEWNWHILGNRYGVNGPIETRLVTQRPNDDYCIPNNIYACEKKWADRDNPFVYERAKKYQWDCFWNTTIASGIDDYGVPPAGVMDGRISCDLYDITGAKKKLNTYFTATSGPYTRRSDDSTFFFAAGGNSVTYFAKHGVPMVLSNFRFSVMQ